METVFDKMKRSIKTVALGEDINIGSLLDSEDYPGHHDPHIWFDISRREHEILTKYSLIMRPNVTPGGTKSC